MILVCVCHWITVNLFHLINLVFAARALDTLHFPLPSSSFSTIQRVVGGRRCSCVHMISLRIHSSISSLWCDLFETFCFRFFWFFDGTNTHTLTHTHFYSDDNGSPSQRPPRGDVARNKYKTVGLLLLLLIVWLSLLDSLSLSQEGHSKKSFDFEGGRGQGVQGVGSRFLEGGKGTT